MKKLAVAGLGLLVLLAVVAPLVTGAITESAWEDLNREFDKSSNGVATMETVEYDRGYLGADVLSKLTLTIPDFAGPVEVYLRSDIAHGLLSARTETRLDPERHAGWLERFEGEPPVLVSHAGLSGDIDGVLKVPQVAEDLEQGGRFSSQPMKMEFALTDNANRAHLTFVWDGFEVSDGENQLRVGEVSLTENLSRLVGEIWVGDISFSVADISNEVPAGSAFVLESLTVTGGSTETDGNRLESRMDVGIENIEVGGEPFGDLRMAFVADNFDIEATNEVLTAFNRLNEAGAAGNGDSEQAVRQLKLFGEVMSALRGLMGQGLSVGIPSMVLNTPEGAAELQFNFAHPQLDATQRDNMMSLLQYSEGSLNLKLPSALVEKAPPGFQQQVYQLYQQGLIAEDNGLFLLNIELDRMTLNVNGHPIRIPPII